MRYGLTELLLNTDRVAPVSGDQHFDYGDRADGDQHYHYGDRADDDDDHMMMMQMKN